MTNTEEPFTDGMMLSAIRDGDARGFEELVRRYRRPLWRVARSRVGRDDWADDVVQETLLCVVRWLHTYDSRYSFRTWLWTILFNQCHRHLKKWSRGLFVPSWTEDPDGDSRLNEQIARGIPRRDLPGCPLEAKERSELLDTLLRQLPEAQADALRLRFFGELKFNEIADTMSCSLSTAKNRVKWGLLKLAELVGPAGEFASWRVALGEWEHDGQD